MLSAGSWLRSHDVLIVSLLVRIDMSRKKLIEKCLVIFNIQLSCYLTLTSHLLF